jgi:hypothetical protein
LAGILSALQSGSNRLLPDLAPLCAGEVGAQRRVRGKALRSM